MKNISLFLFTILLTSCISKIPIHSFEEEIPKPDPDYTKLEHWGAHPNKFDASDLLPENVIDDTLCLDSIDVFYVYPTIYTQGDQWNADVNDIKLNEDIQESSEETKITESSKEAEKPVEKTEPPPGTSK